MSLRQPINAKCKDCIFDDIAPGTWKQQITLCSAKSCPLYEVRPKTNNPIPESVLSFYGVKLDEYQAIKAEFNKEVG